jgi:hypothetical protein
MIAIALALATPFFIFFGSLSDRIGRKWIILGGCLIAALTYFPIFKALTHYGNPALETALKNSPVVVVADPAHPATSSSSRPAPRNSHRPATSRPAAVGRLGQLHHPGRAGRHHRQRQGRRQGLPVVQRGDDADGLNFDKPTARTAKPR